VAWGYRAAYDDLMTLKGSGSGKLSTGYTYGVGGFTKTGTGTWTFDYDYSTGTYGNGYSGDTTCTQGTIIATKQNSFGDKSAVKLNGGTIKATSNTSTVLSVKSLTTGGTSTRIVIGS
jgi:hypothetical protein